MNKKIIITLVALLVAATSFAQSGKSSKEIRQQHFVFGPKAGISMPYQHIVTNTTDLKALLGGPNLGVQLGGFMRGTLPLKKSPFSLHAQLELTWAMDFYFGGGSTASAGCVNIPLTLGGGYKLNDNTTLRLGWGPTYTFNAYTTANTAFKDTDNAYQDEVKGMLNRDPWGWSADLGVDYKMWTIDLRYQNQFRSQEIIRIADEYRFISVGLTVGYKF